MTKLDTLTADAHQTVMTVLQDGSILTIDLDYWAAVERWGISISWPGLAAAPRASAFVVRNLCLSRHPNIMRSWRRIIPFGIYCRTQDQVGPININDFINDRSQLYILNADEVQQMEEAFYQGDAT